MHIRFATLDDAVLLARLNRLLIEDEGHRNAMDRARLEHRMSDWLQGDYGAVIFGLQQEPAGYALYTHRSEYVYLRQLFVVAESRRQGLARAALRWLRSNAWQEARRVRIDVLVDNHVAQAFWRSLGFRDYCLTMEAGTEAATELPFEPSPPPPTT